jgi:hypothetical protein
LLRDDLSRGFDEEMIQTTRNNVNGGMGKMRNVFVSMICELR